MIQVSLVILEIREPTDAIAASPSIHSSLRTSMLQPQSCNAGRSAFLASWIHFPGSRQRSECTPVLPWLVIWLHCGFSCVGSHGHCLLVYNGSSQGGPSPARVSPAPSSPFRPVLSAITTTLPRLCIRGPLRPMHEGGSPPPTVAPAAMPGPGAALPSAWLFPGTPLPINILL